MSFHFMSVWTHSDACKGPPETILAWDENTTIALFEEFKNAYAYDYQSFCGNAAMEQKTNCCWKTYSFDGVSSLLVSQKTVNSTDQFDFWNPVSALGASYCTLETYSPDLTTLVLDDGACQTNLMCQNNSLTVFNASNECIGLNETFTGPSTTTSALLGQIRTGYVTISRAGQIVEWIAYIPTRYSIIYFESPLLIFGGVLVGSGVYASLFGIIWYTRRCFQKVTPLNVGNLVVQSVQLLTTTFLILRYMFVWLDKRFYYMTQISSALISISSLLLLLFSVYITMNGCPWTSWQTNSRQFIVLFSLTVLHFVMVWKSYNNLGRADEWVWKWWEAMTPLWHVLALLGNNLCMALLVVYYADTEVQRSQSRVDVPMKDVVHYILFQSRGALITVFLSILLGIWQIVLGILFYWTNALGTDANSWMVLVLFHITFPWASILSIYLIEWGASLKSRPVALETMEYLLIDGVMIERIS